MRKKEGLSQEEVLHVGSLSKQMLLQSSVDSEWEKSPKEHKNGANSKESENEYDSQHFYSLSLVDNKYI